MSSFLQDHFDGAAATPLTSHTSDSGHAWVATHTYLTPPQLDGAGGLYMPDSGQAYMSGSAADPTTTGAATSYSISFTGDNPSGVGIILLDNWIDFRGFECDIWADAGSGLWQTYRCLNISAGGYPPMSNGSAATTLPVTSGEHTWTVTLSADRMTLTGSLDGIVLDSWTVASPIPETLYPGLFIDGGGSSNLVVLEFGFGAASNFWTANILTTETLT